MTPEWQTASAFMGPALLEQGKEADAALPLRVTPNPVPPPGEAAITSRRETKMNEQQTKKKVKALLDMVDRARQAGDLIDIRDGVHALYADALRATSEPISDESVERVYQWALRAGEIKEMNQ